MHEWYKTVLFIVVVGLFQGCNLQEQTPVMDSAESTSGYNMITAEVATNDSANPTVTLTMASSPTPVPLITSPAITPTPHSAAVQPTVNLGKNTQGYSLAQDEHGHIMVRIPSGNFTMGISEEQLGYLCGLYPDFCQTNHTSLGMPAHDVEISYAYWIDVYEVSYAQYQSCVEAGVCQPIDSDVPLFYVEDGIPEEGTYENYPVVDVTWQDAMQYCSWRGFRLPYEAEWEFAARGTNNYIWPWGDFEPAESLANYLPYRSGIMWIPLVPVSQFEEGASPFGIYNMAGNADEWVMDWYAEYSTDMLINPIGPADGTSHVVRGGSNAGGPVEITSVGRTAQPIDVTYPSIGFRCAQPAR